MTNTVLILGATVLLGLAVIRYRLKGFYDEESDRPASDD
jgi:hypothetical protein